MTSIADLLDEFKAREAPKKRSPDDVEARVLLDMLPIVTARCPFVVGDFVRQQNCYETYRFHDAVCIVTHVYGVPDLRHDTETVELRNDMIVLVRIEDTLREIAVQSWRFRKYEGPVA